MGFDLTPKMYQPKAHTHSTQFGDGGALKMSSTCIVSGDESYVTFLYDLIEELSFII